MARNRVLTFQQITDSRDINIDKCLTVLNERIEGIKKLLDIEGVEVEASDPYLIDWTETMSKHYRDLAAKVENLEQKARLLKDANIKQIQYRANFYIKKNTRKVTWNDIYKLVNSVKAVPYDFI